MEICFNGRFFNEEEPVITVANRSYKWGDGVFETMKLNQNQLLLAPLHFERLFQSLDLLQIQYGQGLSADTLTAQILELCQRNDCTTRARIRLAVFRDEHNTAGYSIEAVPLPDDADQWHPVTIDIFPHARKPQDAFSHLKTANFLPYSLAARYAQEQGLGDALLLNASGRICDSSKANLFLWHRGEVLTPGGDEGCVLGVMRRRVIQWLRENGYTVREQGIGIGDLYAADEAFLTNSIFDMRPVRAFREKEYASTFCADIRQRIFSTIYDENC